MLALVQSESSFGAYVCHRRPAGLHSDQRSCLLTTPTAMLLLECYQPCISTDRMFMKLSRSAQTIKNAFNAVVTGTYIYIEQSRHQSDREKQWKHAFLAGLARKKCLRACRPGGLDQRRPVPGPFQRKESPKCLAEILNFVNLTELRFSSGSLCFWLNRFLMLPSAFLEREKSWESFRFWMVAVLKSAEMRSYVAQMGWVLKNVDAAVNFSVANFPKARCFHSHICPRQLFKGKKIGWLRSWHFSQHAYVILNALFLSPMLFLAMPQHYPNFMQFSLKRGW